MNRLSVFNVPLSPEALGKAIAQGVSPPALDEALLAMVTAVTRRTAEGPLAIYLCAEDEAVALRDRIALIVAKSLSAHVPSTLLVDCDFVRVGLGGAVPQKDAIGFMDFLLYGSSIGVITQETELGVRVVGAGSFPVTKRMPFIATAFEEAARRLLAHARCAIFVGPLFDDDGSVHPLAGAADVVMVARDAATAALVRGDAAEEQILTRGRAEVWSLRLGPAPPAAPRRAAAPAVASTPPARPPAAAPRVTGRPAAEPRYTALVPRLAILGFGVIVIAFVAWWFVQDRSAMETSKAPAAKSANPDTVETAPADTSMTSGAVDTAATDTAATPALPSPADTVSASGVSPASTGARTGGTVLIDSDDIHLMADLEQGWKDWYAIHISSFRESRRAREEVAFLENRQFPVFIVFLDLGAKGKWYRVYAGPFRTREEARDVKKNLDGIPQVRFTRVTKIPE